MKKIITAVILGILFTSQLYAQNIQDTFYGMKLGSTVYANTIINKVGNLGSYTDVEYYAASNLVRFQQITFAGKQWSSAYFGLNKMGRLYCFHLADHFTKRTSAIEQFNHFKNILDSKYPDSNFDEEKMDVRYWGDNGIGVMLSLSYSESRAGTYYYYLQLEYAVVDLAIEVEQKQNLEL